jgi:methionyl aminopeptidase
MIILKSPEEIERIAESCRIVADTIEAIRFMVTPGLTTRDVESFADTHIRELGGVPAFKGYRGYPASICTSVNDEVIHGIPSKRFLQEGDILSIDLGVYKDGFMVMAQLLFLWVK